MEFANKMRRSRSIPSMLALIGAIPFYARFVGEGAGGAAGAGTAEATKDEGAGEGAGDEGAGEGTKDEAAAAKPVVPKAQFDALHKENMRRKAEAQKVADELAALKANAPSKEELDELRQFKVEQEKRREEEAKKRGDFEKLLADEKKKAHDERVRLEGEVAKRDAKYRKERIGNALSMEIPRHTTAPISDVARLFDGMISVGDDDAFVITKDGGWPMDPDTGKEVTLARFIELEIESRDYLARHKPQGGSGSAATSGKGSGKSGNFTAEDIAKMSDEDYNKLRSTLHAQAGKNTAAGAV